MTRLERFREVVNSHTLGDSASLPDDDEVQQFCMIEVNTRDLTAWISTYPDPAEAAREHDSQEYPGDFDIEALIDLDTGDRYVAVTTTTFVRPGEEGE